MSKRAVEAAWKAYPDGESPDWAAEPKIIYKQIASRSAFIQGYEQAEKDLIERTCGTLRRYFHKCVIDDNVVAAIKEIMEKEE